jgi:hypothetical protein
MNVISRRRLIAGTAVAAAVGLAATHVLAQQASIGIVVPVAPPAPRVEVIPEITVERRDREYWQPGYWQWNGRAHDWTEGRYVVRPRAGAVWVPGAWERQGDGWVYMDGRWN